MNRLITTQQYTLPSGAVIGLPVGISATPLTNGNVRLVLKDHRKVATIQDHPVTIPRHLLDYIKLLRSLINAGMYPGGYREVKNNIGDQSYPPGVCRIYVEKEDRYMFRISYPELSKGKALTKSYHLGNSENYEQREPVKLKEATQFREAKLKEYIGAYLNHLNKLEKILIESF